MEKLIKNSIRYKSITFLTVLIVVVLGLYLFTQLPQNEDPSITARFVKIFTYWPGATPEDVELYISKPIEQAASKQDHIYKLKSESLSGLSIITIEISGYITPKEVKQAFQEIRNYIGDAHMNLPQGIIGPIINDRFGETEAYVIGLTSQSGNRSNRELQAMIEQIRDEIKTVDGVGDCRYYGERQEKVYIDISTNDLAALGIYPQQIIKAVKEQNVQMAQPYLYLSGKKLLIETTGIYKSIDQIRNTIIYTDLQGKEYRVKDLKGKVKLGYDEPPRWKTKINSKKSIVLTVSMKRGYHIVNWGKKIDEKIDKIRTKLPVDVNLITLFNQPKGVKKAVNGFLSNFYEAVIIVIVVLGIGLGIRNAGIVSIAIPLIILATFSVMKFRNIELHQMSINALIIVLGMIVDNSIVVIDNIQRYMKMGLNRLDASVKGATEVMMALFSGTAVTIVAFLVLTLMPGNVGEYIVDLPRVISIALVSSFFVALLVVPTLASILSKVNGKIQKKIQDENSKQLSPYAKVYHKFVDITQGHKFITLLILISLFALAIFVALNYIPLSFFPQADKNQFIANIYLPEGWDIYATMDKVGQLETELNTLKNTKVKRPGVFFKKHKALSLVENYVFYIAQGGARFFISVSPKPPQSRYAHLMVTTPSSWHTKKAAKALQKYIDENMTGARFDIILLETGIPVDFPVEVKLVGKDIDKLKEIAVKIEGIVTQTPGITTISNDYGVDSEKIIVKVDQAKAKILGINTYNVAATLYTGFQGLTISKLKAPDRRIAIALRLQKEDRKSIENLKATLFTSTVTGAKHRLDEFAQIYLDSYPSAIVRRQERRTLTVGAYVKGILPSQIIKEIKPKIAKIKLPEGYEIKYGGKMEEQDKAFGDMVPLVILALVLMLLVLSYKFKSVRIALAVYMSIPMSFIGAVIGMFFMKQSLGFMSALGLSSLSGIVVYNAIVMVEFIHNNLKEGKDLINSIKEAGEARTRPILLTTISTIAGLLPLALSGSALFAPMCWVIIFGLAFSTVMTLLMTPLFYVLYGGDKASMLIIKYESEDTKL